MRTLFGTIIASLLHQSQKIKTHFSCVKAAGIRSIASWLVLIQYKPTYDRRIAALSRAQMGLYFLGLVLYQSQKIKTYFSCVKAAGIRSIVSWLVLIQYKPTYDRRIAALSRAQICLYFLGLVLLYSCGKSSQTYAPKKQELRMNLYSDPLSIDPRKPNDALSVSYLKFCFDGLTRMGLDGNPHLSVAESIEISPDQKVYAVVLKETFWSDGHRLTAYDFEKNWKMMLEPSFPCEAITDLFILKNARAAKLNKCSVDEVGVHALDERHLLIELDHPIPAFLSILSTHCYYPAPMHIVSAFPSWAEKAGPHYVCNGPFCLKEWRPSNIMLFEKNERYWDKDAVKLEQIRLLIINDESTELSMFENAELDWAGSPLSVLPFDALASLSGVKTYPMAGTYYYVANIKDPLLKNVHLRRALALAIQRKEIISNITQSGQSPATSYIPPGLCNERRSYFIDGDREAAKAEFALALEELHMTKETFPAITLSYNTMHSHHKIAQAIQNQWRDALGIKVRLENKEWKVFLDEKARGQFQVARMGGMANNYDPVSFLDTYRYLSSSENFCQWTNPQYTELLELADLAVEPEARMARLLEAEKILMEEMPVMPIYFYSGSYLKKDYVKDVYLSELGDIDFKWAYVDIK